MSKPKLPQVLASHSEALTKALQAPLLATWDDAQKHHPAEQPEAIGRVLVKALHLELRTARLGFLYVKKMKRRGQIVLARASKVGGKLEHYAELDLLVEVNWTHWGAMDESRRVALIDHELCHFARTETKKGETKWSMVGHDLEEFDGIARRWGSWRPALAKFANALAEGQQLGLFTHD